MEKQQIKLSNAEIQSGYDRVNWAEGLILQLPDFHEGRNSWLLNYGKGSEATEMRAEKGILWISETQSAETTGGKINPSVTHHKTTIQEVKKEEKGEVEEPYKIRIQAEKYIHHYELVHEIKNFFKRRWLKRLIRDINNEIITPVNNYVSEEKYWDGYVLAKRNIIRMLENRLKKVNEHMKTN